MFLFWTFTVRTPVRQRLFSLRFFVVFFSSVSKPSTEKAINTIIPLSLSSVYSQIHHQSKIIVQFDPIMVVRNCH